MKAIILAAGYATRLYPLTENMPKALLKVGGKAILEHLLDKVLENDEIDEIHIVSNHRFYRIFEAWAQQAQPACPRVPLTVWDDGSTGNENRLGAIGDMWFVIQNAHIDDDVLVAASDNLMDKPLTAFFHDFRMYGKDSLLVGILKDYEERKRYAVLETENGRIVHIVEKPQYPQSDIVAHALYLYRRDTLPLIGQYLKEGNSPDSPGHFPEWLHTRKEMRACLYDGKCVDIGTVQSYMETCETWEKRSD